MICLVGGPGHAQEAAVTDPARGSIIQYAPNESGGRIRLLAAASDSGAVEVIRLALLEAAAAIRRGDLQRAGVFSEIVPAFGASTGLPRRLRCTFRPLPRGGELVLLSDDGETVAAIHQLLAQRPPRPGAL